MLVIAAKVADYLCLKDGYRIVADKSENNKNNKIQFANNFIHVIGGQQLTWPPINNDSKSPISKITHSPEEETKIAPEKNV